MSNEKKMHYFLIASNVLYANQAQTVAASMPVNCMIVSDRQNFNQAMLGTATRNSQIQFMKQIPDDAQSDLQVVGVQIQNINYLGEMTEEDFTHVPSGQKLVEA